MLSVRKREDEATVLPCSTQLPDTHPVALTLKPTAIKASDATIRYSLICKTDGNVGSDKYCHDVYVCTGFVGSSLEAREV